MVAKDDLCSMSVIIPCLNEADHLPFLLSFLSQYPLQVIVVDGGSKDDSVNISKEFNAEVIHSADARRSYQLHVGSKHANGHILYFLHADTIPPEDFVEQIRKAISNGYVGGCFGFEFDSPDKRLQIQAKQTEKLNFFTGGGDQSLFVLKDAYDNLGGYDISLEIMEDFELFRRLRRMGKVCVCPSKMLVSARKYEKNHYWKVQLANVVVFFGFSLGFPQRRLKWFYSAILQ